MGILFAEEQLIKQEYRYRKYKDCIEEITKTDPNFAKHQIMISYSVLSNCVKKLNFDKFPKRKKCPW